MYRLLPFAGYFFGLVIPLYALRDYWAQFSAEAERAILTGQVIALASIMLLLFANMRKVVRPFNYANARFAIPFVVWCLASTLWSISPDTTAVNNILFLLYITTLTVVWRLPVDDVRRLALLGAGTVILTMAPLPIFLPIGDRTLGGIQANLIGSYGFLILILFMLHGRWKFLPGCVSLILIYFAQARTIFVGMCCFWATWIFLYNYRHAMKNRLNIVVLFAMIFMIIGSIYYYFRSNLIEIVSNALNVTSSSRLGSDFTGRGDVWQVAAAKISRNPLKGYGFRTRETADLSYITDALNAHSGMLNILLDVGYIGLAFLALWYLFALWQALDTRPHRFEQQRIVIAAFLVGNVPILIAEPNYISFGSPTSFLTLLALALPLALVDKRAVTIPKRKHAGPPVSEGATCVGRNGPNLPSW